MRKLVEKSANRKMEKTVSGKALAFSYLAIGNRMSRWANEGKEEKFWERMRNVFREDGMI